MMVTPSSMVLEHPAVELPPGGGELHAVVDALDLRRVRGQHRPDRVPVAAQDPHHVGQVLLAAGCCRSSPRLIASASSAPSKE